MWLQRLFIHFQRSGPLCLLLLGIQFDFVQVEGSADGWRQCDSNDPSSFSSDNETPVFTSMGSYELIETVPHDPKSFTQGLELYNATHMYESAGLYKESSIRLVEIATGKVVKETKLDDQFFGEGLTRCRYESPDGSENKKKDQIYLLTWMEQKGFVVDPESLEIQSDFFYRTTNNQGWGVTCDPATDTLYVSDGTNFLHRWNLTTLEEISKTEVRYQFPGQQPRELKHINELEKDHDGLIVANVWYMDILVQIHPDTGFVHMIYDLKTLRPKSKRGPTEDCLNGIAHVSENVYWVTGKLWPFMYKIRLLGHPLSASSS